MARHLPDRRGRAEDRTGSRAREASRAAAVSPWTRPGPRPRRRALRAASPSRSSSSTCVARGVRAERGASPRATPSSPAPSARAVPPGTTAAVVLAAGVARPWSTRRPVSVIGPSPPYDAFGAAATCSAAGPLAAPEGGGAPPRGSAARDTVGPRQAKRAWLASDRGAAWPEGRPRPQGRDAPGLHGA